MAIYIETQQDLLDRHNLQWELCPKCQEDLYHRWCEKCKLQWQFQLVTSFSSFIERLFNPLLAEQSTALLARSEPAPTGPLGVKSKPTSFVRHCSHGVKEYQENLLQWPCLICNHYWANGAAKQQPVSDMEPLWPRSWKQGDLDFWNNPRLWDSITDTHKQMCWDYPQRLEPPKPVILKTTPVYKEPQKPAGSVFDYMLDD